VGLLHHEMRCLDSLIMRAADKARARRQRAGGGPRRVQRRDRAR
jgi:folate-dependent tRNA-U54 methylase TrmFO/GidA